MDDGAELLQFLVIIKLNAATPQRLSQVVPEIVKALKPVSVTAPEVAFTSEKGDTFGYLVKSGNGAAMIYQRIVSPGGNFDTRTPAILLGLDSVLVIEVGRQFMSGEGFGRVAAWLKRK